jgi:hypothetical protein
MRQLRQLLFLILLLEDKQRNYVRKGVDEIEPQDVSCSSSECLLKG